jgi:hypothetical protein
MKRVNVMISDEAKDKLIAFQKYHRMNTQDEALDKILLDMEAPKL